jgi:hypothetical protein
MIRECEGLGIVGPVSAPGGSQSYSGESLDVDLDSGLLVSREDDYNGSVLEK